MYVLTKNEIYIIIIIIIIIIITRSVRYIAERTQKAVYIVRYLWVLLVPDPGQWKTVHTVLWFENLHSFFKQILSNKKSYPANQKDVYRTQKRLN
jgi:hypothetical protein